MSLRVWLPLTKDLRNQGLDDVTVTNNGATFDSAGKLGGCYSFDGSDDYISLNSPAINSCFTGSSQFFSVAMWVYRADATRAILFGDYSLSGAINFNIELTTSNYCRFYWNGTPDWSAGTVTANAWTHICYTYDGSALKIYTNGALASTNTITLASKSKNAGDWYLGRDSRTGTTAFNGKLNDFRIYNHCLSPMEVKELAQGLVLHYPLNRNGWGQENLASQYIMPGGNSPGTISTAGRTNYYGDYGIIIPATENADTYFSIWYSEPLESGATYTLSAEVSGLLSGSYYNFPLFAQNNTSMGIIQFNHNGLNKLTFTMNYTGTITTATVGGKTYYRMFMDDNGRAIASGQGAITIKNIKLEKGSVATPWCPNSSDTLATTMGLNSTTEYDCSGFCNNGTRTGTFSWSSDTPKYTVSTYMPKAALITHPRPVFGGVDQEWSCAVWFKLDNISQASQFLNNFNQGNIILSSTTSLLYLNNGTNDYYMYGKKAITANEWTHIVFVFRNSDALRNVYINGKLSNNYGPNKTSTPRGISDTVTVGTNLAGYISDYRVYATALSADDVKSLYQNCATIDPDGTIRGQIRS